MEIEAALGRDVRVIPVLLQDAPMPSLDELPEALARLARRNAVQISPARWHYDVDRLIETLRKLADAKVAAGEDTAKSSEPAPKEKDGEAGSRRPRLVVGVVAAVVIVAAGAALLRDRGPGSSTASRSPDASVVTTGEAPPSHAVVEIDPETGKVIDMHPNPGGQGFVGKDIALGQGSLWVLGNLGVARLEQDGATALISVDHVEDLGVGTDGVWVTDGEHVSRIDLDHNTLIDTTSVGVAPRRIAVGSSEWILTSGPTAGNQRDDLVRLDESGAITRVQVQGSDVAVPPSGVWVADTAGSQVVLVDRVNVTIKGSASVQAPRWHRPGQRRCLGVQHRGRDDHGGARDLRQRSCTAAYRYRRAPHRPVARTGHGLDGESRWKRHASCRRRGPHVRPWRTGGCHPSRTDDRKGVLSHRLTRRSPRCVCARGRGTASGRRRRPPCHARPPRSTRPRAACRSLRTACPPNRTRPSS